MSRVVRSPNCVRPRAISSQLTTQRLARCRRSEDGGIAAAPPRKSRRRTESGYGGFHEAEMFVVEQQLDLTASGNPVDESATQRPVQAIDVQLELRSGHHL